MPSSCMITDSESFLGAGEESKAIASLDSGVESNNSILCALLYPNLPNALFPGEFSFHGCPGKPHLLAVKINLTTKSLRSLKSRIYQ